LPFLKNGSLSIVRLSITFTPRYAPEEALLTLPSKGINGHMPHGSAQKVTGERWQNARFFGKFVWGSTLGS
jgi:hypothetical protein